MVKMRNSPSDSELRARQIDFTKVNWVLLTTFAYQNFMTKGRGMVVVNSADFLDKPKGVLARIRLVYLEERNVNRNTLADKERKWITDYDPARTLLVGFIGSGFDSYRIDGIGENSPKAIYTRSTHDDESPDTKPPSNAGG